MLGVAAATWLAPTPCMAEAHEAHFYRGRAFGSEATYNPLSVALNRGFDVLQVRSEGRQLLQLELGDDAANVGRSLFVRPVGSVREAGVGDFVRHELLPMGFTAGSARWVPNYTLHLVGGGQTYAALREWYEAHDAPAAAALAAATVLGAALVNETIENKGATRGNTDAIADFYFFDVGGIVLFSFEPVRRFFGRSLALADWSPPPAITYPGLALHNHGQYLAARLALPPAPRLMLFTYFGMSTLFGLSYRLDDGHAVSFGAGPRATRLPGAGQAELHDRVQFTASAGLFVDRSGSLLASLMVADVRDYLVQLNVFPGVAPVLGELGLWAVFDRAGRPLVGLSTRLGVGLGAGP